MLTHTYPSTKRICCRNIRALAAAGCGVTVPVRRGSGKERFEPDALIEELHSPAARLSYVTSFYGHRMWAAAGAFTKEEARFMAEPFADRERLRASWGAYEAAVGALETPEAPRLAEPCPVPT